MDKFYYSLLTLVALYVLPLYCDLRSVDESLNYDITHHMNNATKVVRTKKKHFNINSQNVPVFTPQQKQNQQNEEPTSKSRKTIKRRSNVREMKSRSLNAKSALQTNKRNCRIKAVSKKKKLSNSRKSVLCDKIPNNSKSHVTSTHSIKNQILHKKPGKDLPPKKEFKIKYKLASLKEEDDNVQKGALKDLSKKVFTINYPDDEEEDKIVKTSLPKQHLIDPIEISEDSQSTKPLSKKVFTMKYTLPDVDEVENILEKGALTEVPKNVFTIKYTRTNDDEEKDEIVKRSLPKQHLIDSIEISEDTSDTEDSEDFKYSSDEENSTDSEDSVPEYHKEPEDPSDLKSLEDLLNAED